MSRARIQTVVSWVVAIGFVALGLLYLNAALFSAWMSGGPPNPYPLAWKHLALGQFSTALASFILAAGSYKLVAALPAWRRLPLAFVLAGLLLSLAPYLARFLLQDQCLDRGGSWSNITLECSAK